MKSQTARIAMAGIAAALLAGNSAKPEDHATGADQAGDVEQLSLSDDRDDRVTVPVGIGNFGPFNFLVDTGSQATSISRELADRLDLRDRDTATLVAMASRTQIETVAIDDFQLGSRTMSMPHAPLLEAKNIGQADGILGVDSLQEMRVLLDFRDNSIHVAEPKKLGGRMGYEIIVRAKKRLGQLIITDAYIGKTKIAVIIDTGAQDSIGNLALRDRFVRGDGDRTELTDVAGAKRDTEYRVAPYLELGKIRLNKVAMGFADSPAFAALGLDRQPAMVLGMRQLRRFSRVAIDFSDNRVLFDLPRAKFYERGSWQTRNKVAS